MEHSLGMVSKLIIKVSAKSVSGTCSIQNRTEVKKLLQKVPEHLAFLPVNGHGMTKMEIILPMKVSILVSRIQKSLGILF